MFENLNLASSLSPAGSDYTAITIPVTFEAGSTRATVNVQITENSEIEGSKIFTAVLSSSEPNVMISDGTASVTILDNNG